TVEAPKPRPARRTAPAGPARTTTPSPPPPAPPSTTTPPTAPSTTTTAGQPAAPSPFQPPPSLTTLNSEQIQASQSNSLGGLFFTMPGATSAGLAPGTQRPVLRGLDDFRVRVQENGVGTMDVSDLGQDHGVPLDPLAIQKIQILPGRDALRYGSQAVGGIVEATNNRIPFLAPPGGWQTQILGATTTPASRPTSSSRRRTPPRPSFVPAPSAIRASATSPRASTARRHWIGSARCAAASARPSRRRPWRISPAGGRVPRSRPPAARPGGAHAP